MGAVRPPKLLDLPQDLEFTIALQRDDNLAHTFKMHVCRQTPPLPVSMIRSRKGYNADIDRPSARSRTQAGGVVLVLNAYTTLEREGLPYQLAYE